MTPKEAVEAMLSFVPVENEGITYTRINAIEYRYDRRFFAQLYDRGSHCITVAAVENIRAAEREKEDENEEQNQESGQV